MLRSFVVSPMVTDASRARSAHCGPWARLGLLPVLSIMFEWTTATLIYLQCIFCGRFRKTGAALRNCDRDYTAHLPKL